MVIVHSLGGGNVQILEQSTTEITLVNRTPRLAPFIVVFVDSKIIGALAKAVDLYRSVKPGQTRKGE